MEHLQDWTRRAFLRTAGLSLTGAALLGTTAGRSRAAASRVVRAHTPAATKEFVTQPEVIDDMVEASLRALTGCATGIEGLGLLMGEVKPEDRIVLKLNSMGQDGISGTRKETAASLVRLLRELPTSGGRKVRKEQVIIWENAPLDHVAEHVGDLCEIRPTYRSEDWDVDTANPLHLAHPVNENGLHIQRVVTEADHILSIGALKAHPLTGTAGVMKNFFGVLPVAIPFHTNNPLAIASGGKGWTLEGEMTMTVTADDKEERVTVAAGTYDSDSLAQAIAPQLGNVAAVPMRYGGEMLLFIAGDGIEEMGFSGDLAGAIRVPACKHFPTNVNMTVSDLARHPMVGGKVRLCCVDGIVSIYDNGPYHEPHEWLSFPERPPNPLFFATDPVAVDAAATEVVAAERALHKPEDLKDAFDTSYLQTAESLGIGMASGYEIVDAPLKY